MELPNVSTVLAGCTVTVRNSRDDGLRRQVREALRGYNHTMAPAYFDAPGAPATPHHAFDITIHNEDGTLIAGMVTDIHWGVLHLHHLWVAQHLRGAGVGQALMRRAEQEAQDHHCHYIQFSTFDFQAPDFYRKLGYRVIAQLDDYPPGYCLYFMRKNISAQTHEDDKA